MMFTRFTDRSRKSVEAAVEEARMLGHDSLGDEDLVLGILSADDGPAAAALASLGVTLDGAREASEEMLAGALASIGISFEEVRREAGDAFDMRIPENRRIPFSPAAKKALVGARRRMRTMGDGHLGTEHVLLAVLDDEESAAVRMLARTGVASGALEDRIWEFRDRASG